MSKRNLKDKIRQVGFWTFSGVFWYLVISFFLLSDYPIQDQPFNGKDAYMAVKDALGLAAAFLAPVAAFVLFQDWRTQVNQQVSGDIKQNIDLIKNKYLTLGMGEVEDLLVRTSEFYKIFNNVHQLAVKINKIDKDSQDYIENLNNLLIELPRFWETYTELVYSCDDVNKQNALNVENNAFLIGKRDFYREKRKGHRQKIENLITKLDVLHTVN